MTIVLERFASELAVPPQELQRRSLLAYVERERRLASLDIADLQDRYAAATAIDLAQRINLRQVYAHPAWEDLIEWEQLEAYLARLSDLQTELEQAGV